MSTPNLTLPADVLDKMRNVVNASMDKLATVTPYTRVADARGGGTDNWTNATPFTTPCKVENPVGHEMSAVGDRISQAQAIWTATFPFDVTLKRKDRFTLVGDTVLYEIVNKVDSPTRNIGNRYLVTEADW